jgi:periplasmic copper chaperone A
MPSDVEELVFPAVQIYSSGEEVRWIEPMPASGEEPEHPAPTVALVAATSGESAGTVEGEEAATVADEDEDDDDSDTATVLSIVALVVGALGLVVGGAALVVSRRRTPT